MKILSNIILSSFIALPLLAQNPAGSPVAIHGLLKTKGNRIVGKADTAVSLAGNSLFWSQWAGNFYNTNTIKWLKKDWNSKIIRAAMGVDESGGYITNPTTEKQKVFAVVDACIAEGLYVIIDWHSHHAEDYKTQSIAFFKEMATKYGQYPNVIYEIYNEPLNVSWSQTIRPYAVDVVNEIRKIDPDNLILVGTRNWSQEVVEVGVNPITDVNLAYVLHFYVPTHGKWLRDKAQAALNNGIPLFVSEWGVWGSDADLENWMKFMKANKLSWCNWAVTTKVEPSSVLNPSASSNGNWAETDLTSVGKSVRNYMLNWPNWTALAAPICTLKTAPFVTMNLPGIVEAENYDAGCPDSSYHDSDVSNQGGAYRTDGVDVEACSDAGGGYNLGYLDTDEWLNYSLNILETGLYRVTARISSLAGGGTLKLELDGTKLINDVLIPSTGNWQTWSNVTLGDVYLNNKTGAKLKVLITKSGFNLNRFTFTRIVTTGMEESELSSPVKVYPRISESKFTVESTQEIQQISVYNLSGVIVYQHNSIKEEKFTFGESFPKATYLVVINLKDGSTIKTKVIKQ